MEKCAIWELKFHRSLRNGACVLSFIGFSVIHSLASHFVCSQPFSHAQPFHSALVYLKWSLGKPSFVCFHRFEFWWKFRTQRVKSSYWSCYFTSRLAAFSNPLSMKLTWLRSHSLVMLLLTYSATNKVVTILQNASLGTIASGKYPLWPCGTIATRRSAWRPGRDIQGPRLLPGVSHLLGRDDNDCHCCSFYLQVYAETTAVIFFLVTFPWHQKERPVSSVTAASSCVLRAMTPASRKNKCWFLLCFIAAWHLLERWFLASTLSCSVCGTFSSCVLPN